jgi:hypothetical protein
MRQLRFFVKGPSENCLGQCIRNGIPWNPGVLRSENNGPSRKIHYHIKMIKRHTKILNAAPDSRIQFFDIKSNVKRIYDGKQLRIENCKFVTQ